MLSEQAIRKLIEKGESEFVEFKARVPPDEVLGRILSAFANSHGGHIIIGVTDKKEIVGLTVRVNVEIYRLRKVVKAALPMPADVDTVQIDGKDLIVIEVPKALPAYRPVMTSAGIPFVRLGPNESVMTLEQAFGPLDEELTEREAEKNLGPIKIFVAMSFRNEEEPALQDYWNAMKRAKERTGYSDLEIKRIDLSEGDFEISKQIMEEINGSQIVIADFTLSPRNVYFELGYARGKGKVIIQTAKQGEKMEFDIRNWKTTFYRNATELEEKILPEIKHAYSVVKKRG